MNENKIGQEKFYTSIANYYSDMFPYKPAQMQFVKEHAGGVEGKAVLDIGCSTGLLAKELANQGARVTAIDLNPILLEQAQQHSAHENVRYLMVNMLHIGQEFDDSMYDVVNCFGNTIVHLLDLNDIQQMLNAIYDKLKPRGNFFIQLLNYDYINKEKVGQLPMIETESIKFTRKYQFTEGDPIVQFQTELKLKKENQTIINNAQLLMLGSTQLKEMLDKAGFQDISFYADFLGNPFGGKHLPLVVRCNK